MEAGSASIEMSTLGGVLDVVNALAGHYSSLPHYLYFRKERVGEAIYIENTGTAYYCPQCRGLFVKPVNIDEKGNQSDK
jgi:hypothetical protein